MTYSPKYRHALNKMGYYGYQDGLIYRHMNQEGGWDKHLEKCRNYIMGAMSRLAPSTVTILGSGWLLDLPAVELSERVVKLNLVDIVHPPDVKRQAGQLKNVELIEDDVTGGLIAMIWKIVGDQPLLRRLKTIESLTVPSYKPGFETGLIISLNILSQLDFLLINYLRKKTSIPESEIDMFRKGIQEKHLDFLQGHHSVLISDTEETFHRLNNETEVVKTVIANIPSGSDKEEWDWDFDLKRSDYFTTRSAMKVIALTYGKV